ncbi:MAG: GNAT family N-acetyltransferase [Rhodobacteraceae bacterium]|nr:GNAT family N-acetyltransferase [Paracoccaceae bacterium]MCY4197905.1 GNAT family N-acetyltransferase [Paracoccaceae bacterium]
MMVTQVIDYKNATVADVETMLEWAAREGWNPGLDDAAAFYCADPGGFFAATENGRTVGCISVVNHNDEFAFLGLYIVRPSHRGRGIGIGLWQRGLAHAEDRVVGLDGVHEQQQNYARSGFVLVGRTTRYAGKINGESAVNIRRATHHDIPALVDMEAQASGSKKIRYLANWFENSASRVTFVVEAGDKIAGCATVRRCRNGNKFGPLVAHDTAMARMLFFHAACQFEGDYMIDVPDSSIGMTELCQQAGLQPGFATARMYLGQQPTMMACCYAVATLELG